MPGAIGADVGGTARMVIPAVFAVARMDTGEEGPPVGVARIDTVAGGGAAGFVRIDMVAEAGAMVAAAAPV
jgi:hypothetical protein